MTASRAVIFDFDFTLVDSSAGFIACHRFAAETRGLPRPQDIDIKRTIGTPLPIAFEQLYGKATDITVAEYVRLYQLKADEVMTGLTYVLPAVPATIAALKASSLALAIVSQKLRRRIEEVLEREALRHFFDTVVGGEDLTHLKPDPEGLLTAMARLGVSEATYVGDTVIDAEAARRAGLPFVAVLTGVTGRGEFGVYPTAAILDDLTNLPKVIGVIRPADVSPRHGEGRAAG